MGLTAGAYRGNAVSGVALGVLRRRLLVKRGRIACRPLGDKPSDGRDDISVRLTSGRDPTPQRPAAPSCAVTPSRPHSFTARTSR